MSRFDKEFFDSGVKKKGAYSTYTETDNYLSNTLLSVKLQSILRIESVLDVGCAKGFLVAAFARIGINAFGVDVSEYAISEADHKIQTYLRLADLSQDSLPFPPRSFDLVTALGVLDYLEDLEHGLNEIHSILKPYGHVLVATRRTPNDPYRRNGEDHGTNWPGLVSGRHFKQVLLLKEESDYLKWCLSFSGHSPKSVMVRWMGFNQTGRHAVATRFDRRYFLGLFRKV